MYISPIERLINSFNVLHMTYADDLTLYISLSGDLILLFSVRLIVDTVSRWFTPNDLLVNSTLLEAMMNGTRQQLKGAQFNDISVVG